jgi:hypothetical protein
MMSITLDSVALNVIMPNVAMLNAIAPLQDGVTIASREGELVRLSGENECYAQTL